jgi:hypothetical protein
MRGKANQASDPPDFLGKKKVKLKDRVIKY